MEDEYAEEARMADLRGDSRLAAEKYLLAVQAATNKLSDKRIWSFMSYVSHFIRPSGDEEDNNDYGSTMYLPAEKKDLNILLNSFLNNPDEPAFFRTQAAAALAYIYHIDATVRRDAELAAIYARRSIQEIFKASIEERNFLHQKDDSLGSTTLLGDMLDSARNGINYMLDALEFPADFHASRIVSLPFPVIATSYGLYPKQAIAELVGDSMSLDHFARRLTVGGVTCDCCGMKRDRTDLCSLLCCARCQMAYYCSADCQRRQWKEGGHKKACRKPGEFQEGDAIRLDGLKAMPDYNDGVGLAMRHADSSAGEERRWAVRTYVLPNDSIKMLLFKESNMRRIRPADIR